MRHCDTRRHAEKIFQKKLVKEIGAAANFWKSKSSMKSLMPEKIF